MFFTTKRDAQSLAEQTGDFINKSGIYDVIIKFASVNKGDKGSISIDFNCEYKGSETTFYGLRLTNNDFTSGTLVLEDLDTDKTRIVIKVKDNQVSICKYSRKGRKIDLLDGTHNFNTIIELLEPDTSKIESPYLKRLIHAFASGVSTTLVYGNDHIDPSDFNLSTINELDSKVSDEIKQVKSEILVPGLLSVADEYFAIEKTKDKVIRKD